MARYLADGQLEFLGRKDNQVKIRCYRIELGEVEAALEQHAGVREAAVIVNEEKAGEKRLVAYIVARAAGGVSADELGRHLKEKLPEYMEVAAYVVLEEMPLTANGKIDRRGLPALEWGRGSVEGSHVGARTPAEELVADIWADVCWGSVADRWASRTTSSSWAVILC